MSGLPSGKRKWEFSAFNSQTILIISIQCNVKTFQSMTIAEGVRIDDGMTEVRRAT